MSEGSLLLADEDMGRFGLSSALQLPVIDRMIVPIKIERRVTIEPDSSPCARAALSAKGSDGLAIPGRHPKLSDAVMYALYAHRQAAGLDPSPCRSIALVVDNQVDRSMTFSRRRHPPPAG